MKLALFSDIHANLPALEAVLADIATEEPDALYCLGDLVGYHVWPNEVVEILRQAKIPTIAGNYDVGIGLHSDDCGCAYKSDEEKANGKQSIGYTNDVISPVAREYLRLLPRHLRVEAGSYALPFQLLMVHGSPRKVNEYLFEDRPEKSLERIMENAQADCMLFGHTHKPYHRVLSYEREGKTAYRHAINIGSVGKPKDGDPRACYVLLEWQDVLSPIDPDSLQVRFKRVEYDLSTSVDALRNSPLPDAYAEALETAK